MKNLFIAALSLVLLAGCSGAGDKIQSRAELEDQIKTQLNDEMKARHLTGTFTEVSLVEDGPGKFTGYATASDNSQAKLTVTVGKDGKAIFESDPIVNPGLANGH